VRLVLNGERVGAEEQLLTELKQRIREVRQAADGSIYIIAGASLVRVSPK
jgi:glucose/arabinose dehydrogenase